MGLGALMVPSGTSQGAAVAPATTQFHWQDPSFSTECSMAKLKRKSKTKKQSKATRCVSLVREKMVLEMVSLSLSSFFYFSSSFPFSSEKNGEMKWIETIASEHETTNRRSRQNLFATIESKNSSTELSEHHRIRGFADFETSNLQNVWSGCLARLELSFESALSTALCIQRPRSDGKNKMTRIVAV